MAYVSVPEWTPHQVTEWLKGLDTVILSYSHNFLNNNVGGQKLLDICASDLENLGINKVGHQEIILEAISLLRNFHYDLDRENMQLLAVRLSCSAHSLEQTIKADLKENPRGSQRVRTQIMADVTGVTATIKALVLWIDRQPFASNEKYQEIRAIILSLGLSIATCTQRDRFAENPVEEIMQKCAQLTKLANEIIENSKDPMVLQPASLDIATIRSRQGDDLGFTLARSWHGAHQVVEVNPQSTPHHQSGRIELGDEVVQINYQTVVGWRLKSLLLLFKQESKAQIFLTLKKRPQHSTIYGQVYIKPYRLPSKNRAAALAQWQDSSLPSPRPEFLAIPHFELPRLRSEKTEDTRFLESSSSESENEAPYIRAQPGRSSNIHAGSVLSLMLPRNKIQRRATVSGYSSTYKHVPVGIELFRAQIQREMQRRGLQCPAKSNEDAASIRCHGGSTVSLAVRPSTFLGTVGNQCLDQK
ncbi:connector enhancer of kinase suppressor of ras 2 [Neocloeon triangulifer]|uniref:connector enhancer of kinase suppressor of ras 2 n=1 Tax=Neocloeon triangulifer TaxID=2078957 RepID=UPI00286F330B|nr:connector enhancer of kinase suppressor of ras 2 [Neocloeon triangulifer]